MADFKRMYNESWYTIIGCGDDLEDWKNGYNNLLSKQGIGTPKEWTSFTGKEMNEEYDLQEDNAYPNDLIFLAFSLNELNVSRLAIFKMKAQDHWFDDIVDNNAMQNEYD